MNKTQVTLGGTGSSHGRRRGRSLEDEFEDVLRSVGGTGMNNFGKRPRKPMHWAGLERGSPRDDMGMGRMRLIRSTGVDFKWRCGFSVLARWPRR